MANPEHVESLRQGAEVWNRWRRENPDVIPELDHTNLDGIELVGVNLKGADFRGTNLSKTNLLGSNFFSANFSKAVFVDANIIGSNLSTVNFNATQLWRAKVISSDLNGTILKKALVGRTVFSDVDLSNAIGLEAVVHLGPSTIGIDTIYRSGGKIPEVFLRGCGVPDNFIQYMSSLTGTASKYNSCFISYSSKDQDFAERLHANLQNKGVRCWFAPEDMKIGDKIRDRIDQSIRIHDKLLLVLSEHSINSEWVEDEVEAAYEQERQRGTTVLFPIRLDSAVMDTGKAWAAKLRRSRHIGDFSQWKDHDAYQKAFNRLMRDLKAEEPAGTD